MPCLWESMAGTRCAGFGSWCVRVAYYCSVNISRLAYNIYQRSVTGWGIGNKLLNINIKRGA